MSTERRALVLALLIGCATTSKRDLYSVGEFNRSYKIRNHIIEMCRQIETVCGLAQVKPSAKEIETALSEFKNHHRAVSAGESLDYVVSVNPGYTWDYTNGVVNLFPTNGPVFETLRRVISVDARGATVKQALQEVVKAGSISASVSITGRGSDGPATLKLVDVTVRDALNETLKSCGTFGSWIYEVSSLESGAEAELTVRCPAARTSSH